MITAPPGAGIAEPAGVFGEMLNGILYELLRFLGCGFLSLQATDDLGFLAQGKPHQSGMDPFHGFLGPLAVLGCSHLMEILRAVVIIHHLPGIGEELLNSVPDPIRPVCHHTEPHFLLGNEAGFLDGSKSIGYLMIVRHLVPADHMFDYVLVNEIEPESLDFLPSPCLSFLLRREGSGRTGSCAPSRVIIMTGRQRLPSLIDIIGNKGWKSGGSGILPLPSLFPPLFALISDNV